jgi:hypothetical protein
MWHSQLYRCFDLPSCLFRICCALDLGTETTRRTFTYENPFGASDTGFTYSTPGGDLPARITELQFLFMQRHSPPQSNVNGMHDARHNVTAQSFVVSTRDLCMQLVAWQHDDGRQSSSDSHPLDAAFTAVIVATTTPKKHNARSMWSKKHVSFLSQRETNDKQALVSMGFSQ